MLYLVLQDFDGSVDSRPDDKYVAGTQVKLTEYLAHHAVKHGFVKPVETVTIDNKAVITDGKERPVLGLRRK